MKDILTFCFVLVLIALFSILSCHARSGDRDGSVSTEIINQLDSLLAEDIGDDSIQDDIQNVIDKLTDEVLPTMSGNDKDELSEIITYISDTKEKLPAYIENDDNRIEFLTSMMNLALLFARVNPDDFDMNLKAVASYIVIAASVTSDFNTEKMNRFRDEFNEKGIRAAKALVEKFPDNPMAYGQLAHTTLVTGGDEKEVIRLLNKCLEVDKKTEYCKEFLDHMKNE
jgi:hypothetical protein